MRIEHLAESDLSAAVGLSRAAGWNQTRADWQRLLTASNARCFAGRVDDTLVATSTAITYGGRVCWIGMVLVDPDHRREGFGTALTERALEHGTSGSESVGLDATDAGRPLYRDLGFVDVLPVERRTGVLSPADDSEPVERVGGDHAALAELDHRRLGVDRGPLLAALLDEDGTVGYVAEVGPDRGYAVLRPGRECWQLGPVVADSPAVLDALVAGAATDLDGDPVLVDALGDRSGERFGQHGLSVDRTLTRMSHGRRERLLCGEAVHAAAGLELG